MIYIDPAPNASGAYPNPKNQPFPGCIPLNDEQADTFFEYNGFIRITSTDPVTIEPDTEAWEAWKAAEAEKPPVLAQPTQEERLAALESAMLSMMGVSIDV